MDRSIVTSGALISANLKNFQFMVTLSGRRSIDRLPSKPRLLGIQAINAPPSAIGVRDCDLSVMICKSRKAIWPEALAMARRH
jgi:hypothetical protein